MSFNMTIYFLYFLGAFGVGKSANAPRSTIALFTIASDFLHFALISLKIGLEKNAFGLVYPSKSFNA